MGATLVSNASNHLCQILLIRSQLGPAELQEGGADSRQVGGVQWNGVIMKSVCHSHQVLSTG